MTTQHSPEPWRVERRGGEDWFYAILDANGKEVIQVAGSTPRDDPGVLSITQADAERIVACVNACAAVSTAELKGAEGRGMKRFLVFGGAGYYPGGGWEDFEAAFDDLRAALAAARKNGNPLSWRHVVDLRAGKIVEKFDFDACGKCIHASK